ncbi:MAG: ACT domain-containing protein [Gammaproteobacteria bacterium]|nr:ACT domain-containing protein [Gammaproteobacteria bacterium]
MSGETDLDRLVAGMAPRLQPGEFIFLNFADAAYGDHADLAPVASCREAEGLTLVVPRARAQAAGYDAGSPLRAISLGVHSSLEAVGLTAMIAAALTEHGISANVIAGYYHDHVYVPSERAEEALAVLRKLAD